MNDISRGDAAAYGASPSAAGPLDGYVARWLRGLVAWWLGGLVARWFGGLVAWWLGGWVVRGTGVGGGGWGGNGVRDGVREGGGGLQMILRSYQYVGVDFFFLF